ncbi:Holliday junction resolvase RuvX [Candidatus Uhrbacteria bacterium]|nr:Holliday junction resolvase RuvX [Candidatus Uhrbacteria bacterium]
MRILGIDYGDKKIGLAFGESTARVAVPLEVIQNDGETTLSHLVERVVAEDIDRIVVGVPLPQGNHSSEQLDKTRAFIKSLAGRVSVPVFEEDESFTSVESIRLQQEFHAQADEDALAAMLITQSYIDTL